MSVRPVPAILSSVRRPIARASPATPAARRERDCCAAAVYERARARAGVDGPLDDGVVALDLLRLAGGSQSTLDHALHLGRRRSDAAPGDVRVRLAVHLIEGAVTFLGSRREPHEMLRSLAVVDGVGRP